MRENSPTWEREVKILPIDVADFERRLISLGAEKIGRERQRNWLFDVPEWEKEGSYLRLREKLDTKGEMLSAELTWKENHRHNEMRVNREVSSDVADPNAIREILTALGYPILECAEKERISYSLAGARIDLDRWDPKMFPIPYAEIEVLDEVHLRQILKNLDIADDRICTLSIRELRLRWESGDLEIHA